MSCLFCWDDLLRALNVEDFNVPPERQLLSHGQYDVTHSGQEYVVFTEGEAATEYLEDRTSSGGVVWYRFRLSGAHGGPPIEVFMVHPHWESDSFDGIWFCWQELLWADDYSSFDHDYFLEAYTDPLRDELTEIAKGWD